MSYLLGAGIFLWCSLQSYFFVPRDVRLSTTDFLVIKILKKPEVRQITFDYSSVIGFKVFMEIYRKCTGEKYSFLIINTTLPSDNPLL